MAATLLMFTRKPTTCMSAGSGISFTTSEKAMPSAILRARLASFDNECLRNSATDSGVSKPLEMCNICKVCVIERNETMRQM